MMTLKRRSITVSDTDIALMANLESDGNVTTVTGLTYGEKMHVNAGDAVG